MKEVRSIATGILFFYVAVTTLIAYTQMEITAIFFFGFIFLIVGYAIEEEKNLWRKIFPTKKERYLENLRNSLLAVLLQSQTQNR